MLIVKYLLTLLLFYNATLVFALESIDNIGTPPPVLSPTEHARASMMVRNTLRSHCGEMNRDIVQQAPGSFGPKTIVLFGWCLNQYHGWLYYTDQLSAAKHTIIRQ